LDFYYPVFQLVVVVWYCWLERECAAAGSAIALRQLVAPSGCAFWLHRLAATQIIGLFVLNYAFRVSVCVLYAVQSETACGLCGRIRV